MEAAACFGTGFGAFSRRSAGGGRHPDHGPLAEETFNLHFASYRERDRFRKNALTRALRAMMDSGEVERVHDAKAAAGSAGVWRWKAPPSMPFGARRVRRRPTAGPHHDPYAHPGRVTSLSKLIANVHGELEFIDWALQYRKQGRNVIIARRQALLAQREVLYTTLRVFDPELDPTAIGALQEWMKPFGRKATPRAAGRYFRAHLQA